MSSALIIADDLTGATDSGLQFAALGRSVRVMLTADSVESPEPDVLVVNTDSREWHRDKALLQTAKWAEGWPLAETPLVIKKVDSTLRGNIGAEMEGILSTGVFEAAVVVPAYPANGRLTLQGVHLIHGVALENTEFSCSESNEAALQFGQTDALPTDQLGLGFETNLRSSLPAIVQKQIRGTVDHWDLACIRSGNVEDRMRGGLQKGTAVFTCDCELDQDLELLVKQVMATKRRVLWVGSAGLAAALTPCIDGGDSAPSEHVLPVLSQRPLVVVGSRSATTKGQLQCLVDSRSCVVLDLCGSSILEPDSVTFDRWAIRLAESDALTVLKLDEEPLTAFGLTGKDGAEALAKVVGQLIGAFGFDGLVLTGGETAMHVCQVLGIRGLTVIGRVEEGIPLCMASPTVQPVVTKAGGFGSEWALVKAVRCLERGLE